MDGVMDKGLAFPERTRLCTHKVSVPGFFTVMTAFDVAQQTQKICEEHAEINCDIYLVKANRNCLIFNVYKA